jgi:N-alpha-acetyl-L-2,4-diaminobutyrate deacetylase
MPDARSFVTSLTSGLLEMCVELGAAVRDGDVIARVHHVERTGAEPVAYRATLDGILAGRHFPGLIGVGDTLAVIAVPVGRAGAGAVEGG